MNKILVFSGLLGAVKMIKRVKWRHDWHGAGVVGCNISWVVREGLWENSISTETWVIRSKEKKKEPAMQKNISSSCEPPQGGTFNQEV